MHIINGDRQYQTESSTAHPIQVKDGILFSPLFTCSECQADPYNKATCSCQEVSKRRELLNKAHIPARFISATIETIQPEGACSESMRRLYRYIGAWQAASQPQVGIVVGGSYGVGKTFAFAALLRYLALKCSISCRVIQWSQLLAQIKATFNRDGKAPDVLKVAETAPVVVLDDVGPASRSGWDSQIFDEVISTRYNATLPTFITTNLAIQGQNAANTFMTWAWEHTVSRLNEMCYWITVDGPDRRVRKRTN